MIKDITKGYGFKQLISEPTRITTMSRPLIDITKTTDSSKIAKSIVNTDSFSGHNLIRILQK